MAGRCRVRAPLAASGALYTPHFVKAASVASSGARPSSVSRRDDDHGELTRQTRVADVPGIACPCPRRRPPRARTGTNLERCRGSAWDQRPVRLRTGDDHLRGRPRRSRAFERRVVLDHPARPPRHMGVPDESAAGVQPSTRCGVAALARPITSTCSCCSSTAPIHRRTPSRASRDTTLRRRGSISDP